MPDYFREGNWIQVASGKTFFPVDPRPDEIEIFDIAWALSMQCRYAGHCIKFYSVAEHSVLLSKAVPKEHALWALLHDATEAYLVDVPRPIKHLLSEYKIYEDQLMECVAIRFDLPLKCPEIVKEYDTRILINERDSIMKPGIRSWELDVEPLPCVQISGLNPNDAYEQFMERFAALS